MRTIIIAVAAAALAASGAVAQGASVRTPGQPHKITAKHHSSFAAQASMRAGGTRTAPGAAGYAPDQFRRPDKDIEASRQAGGGGGGGGGGSGM